MTESRSFRIARERGAAVQVGDRTLVPIALVVSLQLALRGHVAGAFTWVRPLAVEVHAGPSVQTVPVPDLTMWGTLGLSLLAAVTAAAGTAVVRSRRTSGAER